MTARARPRVLFTFRWEASPTAYGRMLADSVAPEVEPLTFTWVRALTARYDVLHVQWPEYLLRHRTKVGSAVKRVLFVALMARARVRRTPIVRTVHNLAPHESAGAAERRLGAWLGRRTDLWIRMTSRTELPEGAAARTIPHGSYVGRYPPGARAPLPGRILLFGLIRRYKGIEPLLAAFAGVPPGSGLTLRVVGEPLDPDAADAVRRAASGDPRVTTALERVRDDVLAAEVRAAELVVLPYRRMHNSGALLAALSLGTPVLVPDNAVNADLASEVGPGWVRRFSGDVSADDLLAAVADVRTTARAPARLDARDWSVVGPAHVAAYRDVLAGRGTSRQSAAHRSRGNAARSASADQRGGGSGSSSSATENEAAGDRASRPVPRK